MAAFVAEPVLGAGGAVTPPKTYFEKIQAVLAKYDVLMVADEVITGFFRTGNRFASETFGIRPDIMCIAKQLSSAYLPISAVILNEKVYGPIREQAGEIGILGTGFTYSGHPVPAAVALETLKIYDEMDIGAHVRKVGAHAQERLAALGRHPLVGDTCGVGLIGSVELVKDKETKESFRSLLRRVGDRCLHPSRGAAPRLHRRRHPHRVLPAAHHRGARGRHALRPLELALDDTLAHVRAEGWM